MRTRSTEWDLSLKQLWVSVVRGHVSEAKSGRHRLCLYDQCCWNQAILLHTDVGLICKSEEGTKHSHKYCLCIAQKLLAMQYFRNGTCLEWQK